MRPYVLYHASCADGLGAALAAYLVYRDGADYLAVTHGKPLPALEPDRPVFILDFSYAREVLITLGATNDVTVLDHHASARDALAGIAAASEGTVAATFDMTKSGAVLAWEYFHPDTPLPLFLAYVQDRDLWRWDLDASREINAAIGSYPKTLAAWEHLLLHRGLDDLAREGAALRRSMEERVASHLTQVRGAFIGDHLVPAVNATVDMSEIGNALLHRYPEAPFAAVYFHAANGETRWSLRSMDGRVNVKDVAVGYGGGGHPNAAGFAQPQGSQFITFTHRQSYDDARAEWQRLTDKHHGDVDAAYREGITL